MNYKVFFENNKASRCEPAKEINDKADYAIINHKRVIKSLVVNASNERDALSVAERLVEKLSNPL
jgi:hypothetical protein